MGAGGGEELLPERQEGHVTLSGQVNGAQGDSSKLQQYEEIPEGVLVPCAAYGWRTRTTSSTPRAIDARLRRPVRSASSSARRAGSSSTSAGTRTPTGSPTRPGRPTPRPLRQHGVLPRPDGMRLALQNVYVPWVPPTATNPVGRRLGPGQPDRPRLLRRRACVNASLPTFDLRYVRKTGRAGSTIPVGKSLVFNASYSRETRDGNKNTTFYGGPDYEVATPIDYKTDDFRFGGEFAKGRFFANVTADFNKFTNEVPYAEIDNPERLAAGRTPTTRRATVYNDVDLFRLWLPPDNEAYRSTSPAASPCRRATRSPPRSPPAR